VAYKLVRYIGGIYMVPKFGGPVTVVLVGRGGRFRKHRDWNIDLGIGLQ